MLTGEEAGFLPSPYLANRNDARSSRVACREVEIIELFPLNAEKRFLSDAPATVDVGEVCREIAGLMTFFRDTSGELGGLMTCLSGFPVVEEPTGCLIRGSLSRSGFFLLTTALNLRK